MDDLTSKLPTSGYSVVLRKGMSENAHKHNFQPDEYGLDTDRGTLRVGDGKTPGGIPVDYKGGSIHCVIYKGAAMIVQHRPKGITKKDIVSIRPEAVIEFELFYCVEEDWLYFRRENEWCKIRSCKEFEKADEHT